MRPPFTLRLAGVAAIAALLSAQDVDAQTVNWGSSFADVLLTSQGDSLDGEFQFELGVFHEGFDPAASDPSLWEADWEAFDRATLENGGFNPPLGFISRSAAIDEQGHTDSDAFAPEVQLYDFRDSDVYLWAYRTDKSLAGGNEFALITDSTWKFPATVSPTAPPLEFRLAIGNEAILGGAKNESFALQTASVGAAVPEPSAAFLTVLGGGCLLLHRRRRHCR